MTSARAGAVVDVENVEDEAVDEVVLERDEEADADAEEEALGLTVVTFPSTIHLPFPSWQQVEFPEPQQKLSSGHCVTTTSVAESFWDHQPSGLRTERQATGRLTFSGSAKVQAEGAGEEYGKRQSFKSVIFEQQLPCPRFVCTALSPNWLIVSVLAEAQAIVHASINAPSTAHAEFGNLITWKICRRPLRIYIRKIVSVGAIWSEAVCGECRDGKKRKK